MTTAEVGEESSVRRAHDGKRRTVRWSRNSPARDEVRDERRRDRRIAVALGLLLFAIYLLTMGGHTYSVDGETYLAGTRALAQRETVMDPPDDLDAVVILISHKNGGTTTAAPIGTLLLFLPGFVAGKAIAAAFPEDSKEEVVRLVFLSANPLFTAVTAALLFLLCRALGASRRSSMLLSVVFGLATWAWPHSKTDFSEPGTAMALTAAVLASVHWWRRPSSDRAALAVGFLAGCTVLTRSSTMIFIPVLLAAGVTAHGLDVRGRLRGAMLFAAGGAVPAAAFAYNAWARFGSPVDNGYPPIEYSTPLYEGIHGLFLSPGKGLFWYAPICIVALFAIRQSFHTSRRYVCAVLLILVMHLAVYARFVIWSGENAYGPRYLVPLLPVLVALVAPVIDSGRHWVRGARIAGAAGFLLPGLLGSLMYFNAVYHHSGPNVLKNMDAPAITGIQTYLAWNFQPRSSPIVLHLRGIPALIDNTRDRLQGDDGGITPVMEEYEDRIHWHARAIELDYWWAWWSAKREAPLGYVLLVIPFTLLAIGLLLIRGLRRSRLLPAR